jgi:kumamolisin
MVIGGTSAVAPLWAGLIALINEQRAEPVGYMNPLIYAQAVRTSSAFHDVTQGDNGSFQAASGWDPCTGLGTPDGAQLQSALGGVPAGSPAAHAATAAASGGKRKPAA